MVTCVLPGAYETLKPELDAANVSITVSRNRFRISPSVFNSMADIDRLMEVLGTA